MDDLGAPQFWETSICRILDWDRVIRKKHLALNYGVTRGDRVFLSNGFGYPIVFP